MDDYRDGISAFLTVDACFHKTHAACDENDEQGLTDRDARPHPSLERFEMDLLGALRPIRVDHTKFS
jgi:hypothetical protein